MVSCLVDLAALSRVVLVLTTAGFGLEWEQYGHGLTSRPREVAEVGFLDILVLFGCPAHSGAELVVGTIRLR